MKEIILSTFNQHKTKELSKIFGDDIRLITLRQLDFKEKIVEDGSSFIENSIIKCKQVYKKFKKPVMADDSGLCVDALNGEPGIFSARYGGQGLSDVQRYEYLLKQLKGASNLDASFVCALVLYINFNRIYIVQEETHGKITFKPRGQNGFGYDPILFLPELNKTFAELSDDDKNKISHRGKAAWIMKRVIDEIEF
ncbi:MAG: RdgB/HAM1 family non-canonical purine NTP pyrophosphatase [Spirochaetes bacterium]|nr:RdgB/HAM1 family non-canonical purine NTP pyrophosphatase [Spirochaetota bacterium]